MPHIHRHVFSGEGRFNPETLGHLDEAITNAIEDDECQVLLLAGEGKNFSQGLDLDYLMASGDKVVYGVVHARAGALARGAFPDCVASDRSCLWTGGDDRTGIRLQRDA